jgi:hypothetical protein
MSRMTPLFLILALVAAALAACTSNDHGPQSVQVEVTAINASSNRVFRSITGQAHGSRFQIGPPGGRGGSVPCLHLLAASIRDP